MSDELLKDTALKATKEEKQRIEQEKVKYKSDIERLQKLKAEIERKYNPLTNKNPSFDEVNTALKQMTKNRREIENEVNKADDAKRYEIIHNHIKEVSITKAPNMTATKRIAITYFDNVFYPGEEGLDIFYYSYGCKDKSKQLFQPSMTESGEEVIKDIKNRVYSHIKVEERFTK